MPLFTAGPSEISPQISKILSLPIIHHRSKEFKECFDFCHDKFLEISQMQEVFMLCSSGSGAMESAISSLSPSHLLILENGKFSQRWGEIARSFGIKTTTLSCPWDSSHRVSEVLEVLRDEKSIDGVCLCGVESSGGVREEYELIAQSIKAHNPQILVFLDGIALFGGERIESQNLDILVASSQKILGLPVGLGFVFTSSYALSLLQNRVPKSYYLALQNYLNNPIAFSLPSSLFKALEFVLRNVDFEKNYTLIEERFERTKEILRSKGIALYPQNPSKTIIAFYDPHSQIKNALAQSNILISSGQSHLKESVSRIGNFGGFQEYERLIEGLERV